MGRRGEATQGDGEAREGPREGKGGSVCNVLGRQGAAQDGKPGDEWGGR